LQRKWSIIWFPVEFGLAKRQEENKKKEEQSYGERWYIQLFWHVSWDKESEWTNDLWWTLSRVRRKHAKNVRVWFHLNASGRFRISALNDSKSCKAPIAFERKPAGSWRLDDSCHLPSDRKVRVNGERSIEEYVGRLLVGPVPVLTPAGIFPLRNSLGIPPARSIDVLTRENVSLQRVDSILRECHLVDAIVQIGTNCVARGMLSRKCARVRSDWSPSDGSSRQDGRGDHVERLLPQDRGGEAEEAGGARENGARDEVKQCDFVTCDSPFLDLLPDVAYLFAKHTHTHTRVRVRQTEVCANDSKMRSRRIGPCICIPNNAWPWECAREQHGSPWRTKRVIFNPVIRFCTGLHRTSRERSREDCQVPNEVTRSRGDRQRHAWDLRFYGKARQLDRSSKHAHLKPTLGASIAISREREGERERDQVRRWHSRYFWHERGSSMRSARS